MDSKINQQLRQIPPINELLELEAVEEQMKKWPRDAVVQALRLYVNEIRQKVASKKGQIPESVSAWDLTLRKYFSAWEETFHLRPAINGTGIIIHTNLGRSLLAPIAQKAIARVAGSYSNLEYDLEEGKRGSRYAHVEDLLVQITGAEAGLVVNNNAAAIMLVLDTLAKGGEAVVSRGELVEIGGSFRIPEVMARSGATLREVGTTNKTHLRDYEEAISPETQVLLKVHTSNFRILGFSESVDLLDLAKLAKKTGIPLVEDLGSGVLIDLSQFGLAKEPTVQESIASGADIVTFSGDKLLGGPQAGIIVGRREIVDRIKANQLTRALRIDKLTLASLEATLKLYLLPELALEQIPTLRMLTEPVDLVAKRAISLRKAITANCGSDLVLDIIDDPAEAGGGSLPGTRIPSRAVSLSLPWVEALDLEEWLRTQDPPIIVRLSQNRVLLNTRTITDTEIPIIAETLGKSREVFQ